MAEEDLRERLRETAPGAMLEGPKSVMEKAGKAMLKDTPKGLTRFVITKTPWGPGIAYDVVHVLTAKDKLRAGLGVAGGIAGGALLGEVAGPLGAAAGYSAGEAGAEWLYDHHDELARKAGDTARWMKDRASQLVGQASHRFDRGMPPYSTPLR